MKKAIMVFGLIAGFPFRLLMAGFIFGLGTLLFPGATDVYDDARDILWGKKK